MTLSRPDRLRRIAVSPSVAVLDRSRPCRMEAVKKSPPCAGAAFRRPDGHRPGATALPRQLHGRRPSLSCRSGAPPPGGIGSPCRNQTADPRHQRRGLLLPWLHAAARGRGRPGRSAPRRALPTQQTGHEPRLRAGRGRRRRRAGRDARAPGRTVPGFRDQLLTGDWPERTRCLSWAGGRSDGIVYQLDQLRREHRRPHRGERDDRRRAPSGGVTASPHRRGQSRRGQRVAHLRRRRLDRRRRHSPPGAGQAGARRGQCRTECSRAPPQRCPESAIPD